MDPILPTDDDTNHLFDKVVAILREHFGHSDAEAVRLVREYYRQFSDAAFCRELGIPVQNDDFFHHEAPGGMAWRIQYYLVLKGNPDPHAFIEWRATHQ